MYRLNEPRWVHGRECDAFTNVSLQTALTVCNSILDCLYKATVHNSRNHRPQASKFWQRHVLQFLDGHSLWVAMKRHDELTPIFSNVCFIVDKMLPNRVYLESSRPFGMCDSNSHQNVPCCGCLSALQPFVVF